MESFSLSTNLCVSLQCLFGLMSSCGLRFKQTLKTMSHKGFTLPKFIFLLLYSGLSLLFFVLQFFIVYSITVVLIFSLLPCSTQPTLLSHSQSHSWAIPWVIHTRSLTNPFSFLPPLPPLPSLPIAVSLFYVSMSLVLFFSLVYFVY